MPADVTIVGCGVAGLSAAYPLVKAGARVVMLDAGETPVKKFGWHYPLLGSRAGFAHIHKDGKGRVLVESFVPGGLSEVWGGVCERFNDADLRAAGLPRLDEHYDTIARRIGLTGKFSTYRGHTTLEELKTHPNFEYRKEFVTDIPRASRFTILACGAIGTAKLLKKQTRFYKGNTLYVCVSARRRPLRDLKPAEAFSVGESYVLLYSVLPYIVVVDVRGPRVDLRAQGLYPLARKRLPDGSTAHYAGGIKVDPDGKYADGVYVADASGWTALPAKPITLTIMANANRVGEHVARLLYP